MALNFPGLFPPGKEMSINYNWVDVASGSGYIKFFGFKSNVSGGITYNLSNNVPSVSNYMSESLNTSGDSLLTSVTDTQEINFNTSVFQLPRVVHGTPLISVPFAVRPNATTNFTVSFTARLIRVAVGGAETELTAVVTSSTLSSQRAVAGTPSTYNECLTVSLPAVTSQLVKKGEALRVELIFTLVGSGFANLLTGSTADIYVGLGASGDLKIATNGLFEVDIPFKLDYL